MTKPAVKPQNPCFSSGPCAKRPGWNLAALKDAAVGRSHRATIGRAKLQEVIERSRALLGVPADYRMAVVPGSDTGAVEMCLWSMLGARGVDVLSWESFSKGWATDITQHLRLEDVRVFDADFGELPDLSLSRLRPRRSLCVERHDFRGKGARWRVDRRRPRGP